MVAGVCTRVRERYYGFGGLVAVREGHSGFARFLSAFRVAGYSVFVRRD